MEFAYGVNGPPHWEGRYYHTPLGMAFFMLISCVNNFISKGTWNSHIECPVRPNGRRYYHPAGYGVLYAHFMC
jgi:hypothetical protein